MQQNPCAVPGSRQEALSRQNAEDDQLLDAPAARRLAARNSIKVDGARLHVEHKVVEAAAGSAANPARDEVLPPLDRAPRPEKGGRQVLVEEVIERAGEVVGAKPQLRGPKAEEGNRRCCPGGRALDTVGGAAAEEARMTKGQPTATWLGECDPNGQR